MKTLSLLAGMLMFVFASNISPTSLNGRFLVLSSDAFKISVLVQINTNTGTYGLGGATIVIGFDKSAINFNSSPITGTDFVFHNCCGGNYGTGTVTRPMSDKLWINIDLPFTDSNSGTIVSGPGGWTDVVTIYFSLIAPNDTLRLNWLSSSPFWGVYDGDNKTLWNAGNLSNLEIALSVSSADNGNLDKPISFELAQNYPNPFNPSTSIKYALNKRQFVTLKIYDIIGNEVATLVNEEKEVGRYQAEFNSANLASGVYVYRIQTAEFIDTKKMILLK